MIDYGRLILGCNERAPGSIWDSLLISILAALVSLNVLFKCTQITLVRDGWSIRVYIFESTGVSIVSPSFLSTFPMVDVRITSAEVSTFRC